MKFKHAIQQFFEQLGKAKRVLLAPARPTTLDIAGATSAMALFLSKLEKDVEILAVEDYEQKYKFLPETGKIKTALSGEDALVLVVDTTKKTLGEISYAQEAGKTKVFLKGKDAPFLPGDVSFEAEKTPYDLVIILGAQDLEGLGPSFENNTEIFYNTPKVNIDVHPGNKNFGAINLVNINALSLSEIVTDVIQAFKSDLINEDIATCLLSGIIARTHSFQHPKVTPQSFLKASELVSRGARQQHIVRALFKTKPLPLLKLWGRALARLKDAGNSVISVLSRQDFEKAEAGEDLLPLVFKDLIENMPQRDAVALLAESPAKLILFVAVKAGVQAEVFTEKFGTVEDAGVYAGGNYEIFKFSPEGVGLEEGQSRLAEALAALPS